MTTKLWNVRGHYAGGSTWTWYETETQEEAIAAWNADREEFGIPADKEVRFEVWEQDDAKPIWIAPELR